MGIWGGKSSARTGRRKMEKRKTPGPLRKCNQKTVKNHWKWKWGNNGGVRKVERKKDKTGKNGSAADATTEENAKYESKMKRRCGVGVH